jgi:formate dehydrogenase major subunit
MMNRMGYPQKGYTADIILKEISGIVPFFKGVRWDELGNNGKQWPVKEDGTDTRILHTETFKRGPGRFHSWDYDISPELDENAERFPYILTTGRLLEHYNSGTMTRRTPNREIVTEDVLFVHPLDAEAKGLVTGDFARIFSARGITTMKVKVTDVVKPGVIYTTFHFPEAAINFLTSGIGDEFTLTPEYKVVAVDFEKSLYGIFTRAECRSDMKNE